LLSPPRIRLNDYLLWIQHHIMIIMLHRSTTETGSCKELNRLNLPRTEQINFNTRLNKVTNKYRYKNPKLFKDLKTTICSEPLPCSAYCLPKDHKEGPNVKVDLYTQLQIHPQLLYPST
jgi:hypothetical protein